MIITARLTADAKVNTLKDDRQVVNFTVVINDCYKTKNSSEVKNIATFIHCKYWINPNVAKHLTKGSLVELYGRIGVNVYKDMQGEPKASLTFHVNDIKLHSKSKMKEERQTSTAVPNITEPLEDLPF